MNEIIKITIGIGDIRTEENTVFSYPFHTHDHYEMTVYEPFEGKICINGTEFETSNGIATLIAPLDFHEIRVKGQSEARYIKISFAADIPKDAPQGISAVIKSIAPDDFERPLFTEISANIKNTAYAQSLIECALNMFFSKGEAISCGKCTNAQMLAKSAARYINNHFREDIKLETVAKGLAIAPQYLSHLFKLNLGVNFSKYLIDVRLRYAEKLIISTDKSLTDICFLSGFGNFSHFSRSFKNEYLASPRDYRKQRKGGR